MGIWLKRSAWLQLACAALVALPGVAIGQPVQEPQMKAAFVYNFVLFTDWPQELIRGDSINVCVNADGETQQALQGLNGKPAKGQRLKVFRKNSLSGEAGQCHVLYVDRVDRMSWPTIRKNASEGRMLTITDDEDIGRSGAMISLTLVDNKMVFDIDQGSARQSRLTFSSKLLRLARTVK